MGLFISFFIVELILRIFEINYGKAPMERSYVYHHVHPKNYSFLMHDEDGEREFGGHRVYYDQNRFRVKDKTIKNSLIKDNFNSIIFLGDSFTVGNQVKYEDTFVSKIEEISKRKTINFGTSSYSPVIYLAQVNNFFSEIKSNLVIMQIYSNDFNNDAKYSQKLVKDNSKIKINGGKNNFLISFLRNFYTARFIRKNQLLIKEILRNNDTISITGNKYKQSFIKEQNIKIDKIDYTSRIIKEIEIELKLLNKNLIVFMIPSRSLSKLRICCNEDKIYQNFKDRMKELQITFIDVAPYFEEYKDQNNLFFNSDIHLTVEGHKLVANSIIHKIK